ncbi:MAG: B12-binding domain-containing radical SAM protein [bacterium]
MNAARSADPVRVLLMSRIHEPGRHVVDPQQQARKALGAFCLEAYVRAQPSLRDRVRIEIHSFLRDAPMSRPVEEVLRQQPHVLGLTCQAWNYEDHIRLGRLIRSLAPDTLIVHGGPMVVGRRRYLERVGADAVHVVVEGAGEEIFADLLRHVLDGTPRLEDIPGIGFFDEQGQPRVTADRTPPRLSELPPMITPENLRRMGPYVLYETSRGCPYACAFCNWGSHKIQYRSRDAILQDLAAILGHPGTESLWIVDSAVDIRKDHALFLADAIRRHRKHKVIVVGYLFLKARNLDFVRELRGAFDTVQLGLQSADPDILGGMGRTGLKPERFDDMFRKVLSWFPGLRVDLMFGLPNQQLADLQQSVRELLQRGIRFINTFRLVVIPGTEIGENRERYGIVAEDWSPWEVHACAGVSPDEMIRMLRFKENLDILRGLLATGCYGQALEGGVDLVDFVTCLHLHSPELIASVSREDEHDVELEPAHVELLLSAARRYTEGAPEQGRLLRRLVVEAYPSDASDSPAAASDRGVRPASQTLKIPFRVEGEPWFICAERVTPEGHYFAELNGLGLYYGWEDRRQPSAEAHVTRFMRTLIQRLGSAGSFASDLAGGGDLLRKLVFQELARQPWAETS